MGMDAYMDLAYIPGERFAAKVLYIYPFLTAKTRTARLRLEFANLDYKLKPGMYSNVYISSIIDEDTLIVPQEAVIDSGVRKLVFVALGKGKFQPREIRVGAEGNNHDFQVLDGLSEGEEIVVSAQFMLDSESRLREAISKMLESRRQSSGHSHAVKGHPADDNALDLSGETMDMQYMGEDDLDLTDITMEDMPD
jgi:Cu(I)/Ag(I) efflux system membrane fusion protein/cobalt-zinc-cadmium efflux system membrane fusion protein